MKKILFVIGQMSNGGAERVISILANYLSNNNRVGIACLIKDDQVYKLNANIEYFANIDNNYRKIKRVLKNYKFLKNTIRKFEPDIVISFTTEINIYSCFYKFFHHKIRLIISERNDPYNDPKSKIKHILRKICYPNADRYVFQTKYAQEYFSSRIQKKSIVIGNPIQDSLPIHDFDNENNKIVTVARLSPQKRIPLLIEAFKVLSNIYDDLILEIYGDGPDRDIINDMITREGLGNKVFLKGFCKNVCNEIVSSKAFFLVSDYEGISNAMLEAVCMGIPSIITDCPAYGAREIYSSDLNLTLIKCNDVNSIVEAYINLMRVDKEVLKSKKGYIFLRDNLNAQEISKKWETLINEE